MPEGMRLPGAVVPFLRAVLSGVPAAWPPLPEAEVPGLLGACRWHGVMPLLHEATREPGLALPAAVARGLRDGYVASAVGWGLWRPERDAIAAALRREGIVFAVLKGAALVDRVYAHPALRPLGDLDLLVGESGMVPAARLLEALGYRRQAEEAEGYRHHWTFVRPLGAAMSLTVELHRRLMASPPYDRLLDTEALLGRSVAGAPGRDAPGGQGRAEAPASGPPVLAPVDTALHLAGHLVLQHARQERLIWVADIDRLVRGEACSSFWDDVVGRARSSLLARSVADGLRMSQVWFGTSVPGEVLSGLDAAVTAREAAAYRRLRARAPVGHEGARLWADVAGIPTLGAKVRFGLAHAFPPRALARRGRRPGPAGGLPVYYGRRLLRGALDIVCAGLRRGGGDRAELPEDRMVEP